MPAGNKSTSSHPASAALKDIYYLQCLSSLSVYLLNSRRSDSKVVDIKEPIAHSILWLILALYIYMTHFHNQVLQVLSLKSRSSNTERFPGRHRVIGDVLIHTYKSHCSLLRQVVSGTFTVLCVIIVFDLTITFLKHLCNTARCALSVD